VHGVDVRFFDFFGLAGFIKRDSGRAGHAAAMLLRWRGGMARMDGGLLQRRWALAGRTVSLSKMRHECKQNGNIRTPFAEPTLDNEASDATRLIRTGWWIDWPVAFGTLEAKPTCH